MHVSLTDRLDEYVREKVTSGLYNNASEVIREALRLKISTEETNAMKLEHLRHAIHPALEQAERGEFADYALSKSIAKLRAGG